MRLVSRRWWLVVPGAALAVVGLALVIDAVPATESRVRDGEGALTSLPGPGHVADAVLPTGASETWTFGVGLCVEQEDGVPVALETVGPDSTVGSGFALVGAGVREFTPTADHQILISTEGFPPPSQDVPDALRPVAGFTVTTPCESLPGSPVTELLVGLRRTSLDGGGWRAIDVGYRVNDRRETLVTNQELLICGSSLPDHCVGQTPAPMP